MKKQGTGKSAEVTRRVSLCNAAIEIGGQVFTPNHDTAYIEFNICHAFPVVTTDGTALHPQVVANSYASMAMKVFDYGHLIRSYDPKNTPRDRILGTVMGVEFPNRQSLSSLNADGSWRVSRTVESAPGIRGVACVHRAAEQAELILNSYFLGTSPWTVSMENRFYMEDSGFILKKPGDLKSFNASTPDDLRELDWTYVPAEEAPTALLDCFSVEPPKLVRKWNGGETVVLLGGLNGRVEFFGVGLTPLGKEHAAEVSRMLASGFALVDCDGTLLLKELAPLWDTAKLLPKLLA